MQTELNGLIYHRTFSEPLTSECARKSRTRQVGVKRFSTNPERFCAFGWQLKQREKPLAGILLAADQDGFTSIFLQMQGRENLHQKMVIEANPLLVITNM